MDIFGNSISLGTGLLLLLSLVIALGFEFVNGFHDTANAVATVIYTRALRPWVAVVWSGLVNFLGVILGGTAVAFGIVNLIPAQLLTNLGPMSGILMVLSLLLSAMIWNLGTWYFGIPASSSHTLIGSILGVGLVSSFFSGNGFGSGVNWAKAYEIMLSLLVSPLIGFCSAGLLLLLLKAIVKKPELYQEPATDVPLPLWIRIILWLTCTGVSFAHGSNDGQKGMGLIMLVLIGVLPMQYALNPETTPADYLKTAQTVVSVQHIVRLNPSHLDEKTKALPQELEKLEALLQQAGTTTAITGEARTELRRQIVKVDDLLGKFEKAKGEPLAKSYKTDLGKARKQIKGLSDYVVGWVIIAVALSLGIGTMVGWKRIVKTIGERIGKTHMTYAQGASAELVAAIMISVAASLGLPVSTTHVLSSGVAGTMAANRSGLQTATVRNILLAWVLTLPVTILLSGFLFYLSTGGSIKTAYTVSNPPPVTAPLKR